MPRGPEVAGPETPLIKCARTRLACESEVSVRDLHEVLTQAEPLRELNAVARDYLHFRFGHEGKATTFLRPSSSPCANRSCGLWGRDGCHMLTVPLHGTWCVAYVQWADIGFQHTISTALFYRRATRLANTKVHRTFTKCQNPMKSSID